MKLPITFVMNQTYDVWTEADIEAGETNNRGFDFEKRDFDLEELKAHIENNGFREPSESPVSSSHVWLNSPSESTGTQINYGLHLSYIKDADGMPLDGVAEGKIWRNLVRQVVGEKHLEPEDDLSP